MILYITIAISVVLLWNVFRSVAQPGIALALMWSLYPAEQLLQQGHTVFIKASSIINFLFTGVCIAAVFNSLRLGRYRGWQVPPEGRYCFGLFTIAYLSYVWSISPNTSLTHLSAHLPYIVAFILIAPLCITDEKQLRLAINTTVFMGAAILVGHAFSGYGSRGLELTVVGGKTVEGNPLAVASYGGYVGICALFSVYGRKFSPLVALKVAIFFLAAFVIIKSSTRGQLIALVLVSFVWLPIIARTTMKRSTVLAMLGSAAIAGIAFYVFNNVLLGTGRWQAANIDGASTGRVEMAISLLGYWFGEGPLAWLLGTGNSSSYKIVGFYPHNVPAEILAEEGLIGFGFFVAFVVSVMFRSGKMMFSEHLRTESRVNLGILLAMFCFDGILSLKQGSMLGSPSLFGAGMAIGWLGNQLRVSARRSMRSKYFSERAMLIPPAEQMAQHYRHRF